MSALMMSSKHAFSLMYSFRSTVIASRKMSTNSIKLYRSFCSSVKSESSNVDPDMPDTTVGNPYEPEKLQCILCKYNIDVDYKNTKLLSQFVSPYTGIVYQKHITGLCEQQQKVIEKAVKLAVFARLMPGEHKDLRYLKDPKLFNPFMPTRPHPH